MHLLVILGGLLLGFILALLKLYLFWKKIQPVVRLVLRRFMRYFYIRRRKRYRRALQYLAMTNLSEEAARAFLREKGLFPKEARFLLRRHGRKQPRKVLAAPRESRAA